MTMSVRDSCLKNKKVCVNDLGLHPIYYLRVPIVFVTNCSVTKDDVSSMEVE